MTEERVPTEDTVMVLTVKVEERIMKAFTERIHSIEKVFEKIEWIRRSEGETPAVIVVWRGVSPGGVVVFIFLLVVAQHLVGLSYLLEPLLSVTLFILVWMKL